MLTCLASIAHAITTYSGSIDIHKTSLTSVDVEYTFVLDQTDSVFSSDSFKSTISCAGGSTTIIISYPIETSKVKQYTNCARTEYKWQLVYEITLDLSDASFSSLTGCCDLIIDASCGKRSNSITSLATTSSDFYIYTAFENCNTIQNSTPVRTSILHITSFVNQPFYFSQGRFDRANFDSISYTLVSPLSGKGSSLTFKSGYYADQPVMSFYPSGKSYPYNDYRADPPIGFYLGNIAGDFIYTPTSLTDAGPIVLEISEWRKDNRGKYSKISTAHTELYVSTSASLENNPPTIMGTRSHTAVVGQQLCFDIQTDDQIFVPPPPAVPPLADTVSLSWNRAIPNATFTILNPSSRLKTGRFCWTPIQGSESPLPYTFNVVARDNSCPLNAITTASFLISVSKTARVENLQRTKNFNIDIYPNPANQTINLSRSFEQIFIVNSLGQEVASEIQARVIAVNDLPPGVYYIQAKDNEMQYHGKFIKN